MEVLTTEAIRDLLPSILFYLAVGVLGAFSKEAYNVMTHKSKRIRISEIIIGGLVSTFMCIGLSDTLFKNFSLNTMALTSFVLGGLGFEIFGNVTSIEKLRNLIAVFYEVKNGTGVAPTIAEPYKQQEREEVTDEVQVPTSNESHPVTVEERDGVIQIVIMTDNPNLANRGEDNPEE